MQAKPYHMVPVTQNKFKNRQESLIAISQPCGIHGGGGAGGGRAEPAEKGHQQESGPLEMFCVLIWVELPGTY